MRVPILMYHRVIDPALAGDSLPSLIVPPALFRAQMAALAAAGWHAITLRALDAYLLSGRQPPPRTFVPTFDDGYRDGYLYAWPILREFGFVGTYFVVTGRIGRLVDNLEPQDLCALTRGGNEVANHTVDHVDVPALPAASMAAEIDVATQGITAWTGVRPVDFAYPFGAFGQAEIDHLAAQGYVTAVTTRWGAYENWYSRFLTPRIRVGPGTSAAGLLATLDAYR